MLIITYSINTCRRDAQNGRRTLRLSCFFKSEEDETITPAQLSQKVRINLFDACCSSRIHTHTYATAYILTSVVHGSDYLGHARV